MAYAASLLRAEPDLEIELEREDLARLLDRAMALLPAETRQVLVRRYVEELPQAEIARQLRTSEGAIEARLQRGKLTLRRLLTMTLRDEAASLGIIRPATTWLPTRIWCPICGERRLLGRFGNGHASLELRCPACCESPTAFVANACLPDVLRDVAGFKPAYARLLGHLGASLGLRSERPSCLDCGGPVRLHQKAGPYAGWANPSFRQSCAHCGSSWDFTMLGFLLALPAGKRFWQRHPRLRSLPVREVEAAGLPALVAGLEDVTGRATLEVVCARDTLAVSSVRG